MAASFNTDNVTRVFEDVIVREEIPADGAKQERALKVICVVFIGSDVMVIQSTQKVREQLGL
jgi:hypothetical protein